MLEVKFKFNLTPQNRLIRKSLHSSYELVLFLIDVGLPTGDFDTSTI